MNLPKEGDPFCLQDSLTYNELLTYFCRHGSGHRVAIFLASSELVSLVNDAQWDIERIRPFVTWFVDTDAVLFEDLDPEGEEHFANIADSLDFWDFGVSPTLCVFIEIILNSAPTHTMVRLPDDNDKMVIVEPVYDGYHVLVARMGAMVNCEFKYRQERTVWWGDETPTLFEVDDFDDLATLLQQVHRGENPDCRTLWFDKQKQKPAPVCLATTTPEAAPSAALATTASDHTPVAAKTYPVPPHESSKQHSRSRSPALSEASSTSSGEIVFQGRGNISRDKKTSL